MKNKYIWKAIFIVLVFININTNCFSINKYNDDKSHFWLNNINDKDIKIEIKSMDIINKTINLDKKYYNYSIITINIKNTGLEYVELSNINYYLYQGNKKLETFVQSNDNYLGFVGMLSSGENKEVKICVALENIKEPLELTLENSSDIKGESIIKVINI